MSLLEDVFLEDETEEARALERVIEGDEYEALDIRSDDDRNSAEEAEEDKRRVDPTKEKTKRTIKNPRFLLNPARLTGPRGIQVIPDHFKDFKFKGKGHEREDLDIVLKRLEHWAYRLYPKFKFEDCLKKIETLGKKRPVAVHLHKIRSGQISSDEPVIQKDSSDDEAPMVEEDEFDKLLQQQIDIARSTPAAKATKSNEESVRSPIAVPQVATSSAMTDEQRERMMRNRQLAIERRLAKMKRNNDTSNTTNENNVKTLVPNDVNINDKEIHNNPNQDDVIRDCSEKHSQGNDDQAKTNMVTISKGLNQSDEANSLTDEHNDSTVQMVSVNVHVTQNGDEIVEMNKEMGNEKRLNYSNNDHSDSTGEVISVDIHETDNSKSILKPKVIDGLNNHKGGKVETNLTETSKYAMKFVDTEICDYDFHESIAIENSERLILNDAERNHVDDDVEMMDDNDVQDFLKNDIVFDIVKEKDQNDH